MKNCGLALQCSHLMLVQDKDSVKAQAPRTTGMKLDPIIRSWWHSSSAHKRGLFPRIGTFHLIYWLSNLRCKALSQPLCNHVNLGLDFEHIINTAQCMKAAVCMSWNSIFIRLVWREQWSFRAANRGWFYQCCGVIKANQSRNLRICSTSPNMHQCMRRLTDEWFSIFGLLI